MLKITIIYNSKGNNTKEIAEIISNGATQVSDIEVKIMSLEDIDYDFLKESKAAIFGTPTYYANISWQLKKWFDESWKINLEGKIGAVFATEDYLGGGADLALSTMINHMMVKGMLVYSGGSALGEPYIHLGIVSIKNGDKAQKDRAKIFGQRIAIKTKELFGNWMREK